jgi:hypothetical protein
MGHIVNIGIDFGTSSTKVAYQLAGKIQVCPIIFEPESKLAFYPPYCIPSVITVDKNGELLLGWPAAHSSLRPGSRKPLYSLKMLLAGSYAREFHDPALTKDAKRVTRHLGWSEELTTPDVLTGLYLLHVMRVAYQRVSEEYAAPDFELDPTFTIGMPIHHIECRPVREAFEKILAVIQSMLKSYVLPEKLSHGFNSWESIAKKVAGALKNRKLVYKHDDDRTRVFFKPETVAQIASYRNSAARKGGLHVMVDIGSGTTDVTIMNLEDARRPGKEVLEIFAWCNVPVGTRLLEEELSKTLGTSSRERILGRIVKYDESVEGPVIQMVQKIWESTKPAWVDAYRFSVHVMGYDLRQYMGDKVTVLMCGGGSWLPGSMQKFSNSHMKFMESMPFPPNPTIPLPCPVRGEYDSHAGVPFQRMSVAFGLASRREFRWVVAPSIADPKAPENGNV